jgi:uncharacterized membrane protein
MNTTSLASEPKSQTKKTPLILKILVVLGMMTLMGGTLTGVMTYLNLGFTDTFFKAWISSFLTATVTVIPMGFAIMALLTKGAEKLLPTMATKARDALVGIVMALIMESGMAFTTAVNNVGLKDKAVFFSAWLDGLLGALPVALVLMAIVSMTIKPKVEKFLKS